MPTTLTCKLTYFKKSGRYYHQGSFDVAATHELFEIWDHVRARRDAGRLPGLVDGAGREFMILAEVPGHRYEHPHLII